MTLPTQSKMMAALYGPVIAPIVYDRCQELGQDFNERVQSYIYDQIWAREGLALKEKSLVTLVALMVINKAEQLKIHFWGFFHQGGTPEDVRNMLSLMKRKQYISSIESAMAIFELAMKEYCEMTKTVLKTGASFYLEGAREEAIIYFASHIALGDHAKTELCVRAILKDKLLTAMDLENIMSHEAVYCGFPVEMNGRVVLRAVLKACQ